MNQPSEPAAGDLDRLLLLRDRVDHAVADFDLESETTAPVRVWARVQAVGAATYAAGVQAGNLVTHRVTIRYRGGVSDSSELVDGATVYRVKRSAPLGAARRWLLLDVEELTGNG